MRHKTARVQCGGTAWAAPAMPKLHFSRRRHGNRHGRCGGHVQEAFECAVTFEPHAHSVVGSVLAFMIVYRFKFAYDRYYEAKTAISELYCGLRNFNIGACAFLLGDGAVAKAARLHTYLRCSLWNDGHHISIPCAIGA